MAVGSTTQAIQDLASAKAPARMMGIEEELARAARRRRRPGAGAAVRLPQGPNTFQSFRALPTSELGGAVPGPDAALTFLHRLAADRGIAGIMAQNKCAQLAPLRWMRHNLCA